LPLPTKSIFINDDQALIQGHAFHEKSRELRDKPMSSLRGKRNGTFEWIEGGTITDVHALPGSTHGFSEISELTSETDSVRTSSHTARTVIPHRPPTNWTPPPCDKQQPFKTGMH
jgi:hypothetical protein